MADMLPKTTLYTRKTQRTFTVLRQYGWILALLIGVGGQFYPRLGLLVPVLMVLMIFFSLFSGRYWCGNFCLHGSYFDVLVQRISPERKMPSMFQSKITQSVVLIVFIVRITSRLYDALTSVDQALIPDRIGLIFSSTYLMVLLIGTLLGVLLSSRTWCRICPMGTIQDLMYSFGKRLGIAQGHDPLVTLVEPEKCRECGLCSQVCPVQLTPHTNFSENGVFDDSQCIRCSTCVDSCPLKILALKKRSDSVS